MKVDQMRPAIFYFMAVDARIKFGITSNWNRRWWQYLKDLGDFATEPFKQEEYEYRWQAELVEQVLKWRVRHFVTSGEHEWVEHLPIDVILHAYRDTRDSLKPEFQRHEHIHMKGEDRWAYYRQLARMEFTDHLGG